MMPKFSILEILKTETYNDLILALTIMMKSSQIAIKKSSVKIFMNVMQNAKSQMYEEIQIVTKRKCFSENATFVYCERNNNKKKENINLLGYII